MLDAAFSFGTSPDGYQSAFATIEDGSITEMYIAEDFKKGTSTIYYINKKKYIVVLSFFDDACQCFKTDLAALTGWL